MTTIADVAAHAGVSKATASRALSGRGYVSEATRDRVQAAAAELSYVAHSSAISLATGRSLAVGVIMPQLHRWFFAEMLTGIQHALFTDGYDLVLYGIPEGSEERSRLFAELLPGKRLDGIVAIGIQPSARELERLLRADSPVVVVGAYSPGASAVSIDDADAARIATEHLIDLGHRDIILLGGRADAARHAVGDQRRFDGYTAAMLAAGLSPRHVPAATTMPGSYDAAVRTLGDRRDRPTAIVGVCDESAISGIIAARRLGIAIPTDLSVVGIDDHEHAEMFSLTTVRQRPREQGATAVRLLRERMDDPAAPLRQTVLPAELVVRSSTSTAPL